MRGELSSLGMRHLRGSRGAVTFEGSMEDGMRACLWSRTAMRVLAPLVAFPCPDAAALYDGVRTIDWTEWLTVKTTLAVDATGTAPGLHHTGFVALKVKDGVVDSLRDALGGRPDVDTRDPDVRLVVHLSRGQAVFVLTSPVLPSTGAGTGTRCGTRPSRRRWPRRCSRSGRRRSTAPSSTRSADPARWPWNTRSPPAGSRPASTAPSASSAGRATAGSGSRPGTA